LSSHATAIGARCPFFHQVVGGGEGKVVVGGGRHQLFDHSALILELAVVVPVEPDLVEQVEVALAHHHLDGPVTTVTDDPVSVNVSVGDAVTVGVCEIRV